MSNDKENNEQTEILKEILKWIKVTSFKDVKQVLDSTLDTDEKKAVYQLSDGKSKPDIAKLAKVSSETVKNYWRNWKKIGITESQSFTGGPRQIKQFDLNDFNLLHKASKKTRSDK